MKCIYKTLVCTLITAAMWLHLIFKKSTFIKHTILIFLEFSIFHVLFIHTWIVYGKPEENLVSRPTINIFNNKWEQRTSINYWEFLIFFYFFTNFQLSVLLRRVLKFSHRRKIKKKTNKIMKCTMLRCTTFVTSV